MMQTTQTPLLWTDLLAIEPRLAQFEIAAKQAAKHGWHSHLAWLVEYEHFRRGIVAVAERLACDAADVQQCAINHLSDIACRTRQRASQEATNRVGALPPMGGKVGKPHPLPFSLGKIGAEGVEPANGDR
jgi:hypothetical protein